MAELHVPEGSTDTRDQVIEARISRANIFEAQGIRFDNEFPGGAYAEVTALEDGTFELVVKPENTPINDSAWFAFRVMSTGAAREITVRLRYIGCTHRYQPKLSTDGKSWTPLEAARLGLAGDRRSVELRLAVGPSPLWVAAQELLTSADMIGWAEALASRPFVKLERIGRSVLGKDLVALRITEATAERAHVIVLGRQHPPEATGSMALMAFVEALCGDDERAREFRRHFEIVVIPMLNPDGVDDGHWRHNRHGVDLNRDWAHFRQQETRAARDALLPLRSAPVAFAVDFHSTFKDVFYVLRDTLTSRTLAAEWIDAIALARPSYTYRVQAVTPDVPAASNWLSQTFAAPAVTYEVGDDTDRAALRDISGAAATSLMELLLKRGR